MASRLRSTLLTWTTLVPVLAALLLVLTWGRSIGYAVVVLVALALGAAVLAAVHHAEVVAHRVGEPFGSLVLAVAVTVIEVGLIVTLMISGGSGAATLARDTVFAAVMITLNGIVGLVLLIGALRFNIPRFNAEGTGTALATVAALATLTLVLPTFTTSRPGPEFSPAQLAFAAIASLIIYGVFVFTQTGRHRDFFLPVTSDGTVVAEEEHADPPTTRDALFSLALLVVALVAVVGLAKIESPAIEAGVEAVGYPQSFVGVVIALLVLLPETLAAVPRRPTRPGADRFQPGHRFGDGQHRADHPGDRGGLDLARRSAGVGPELKPDRAARGHLRGGHPHRGPRPGDPPGGRAPPGPAGRLPVPGRQPIATAAAIRATSGGPLCPMAPPMPAPCARPSASRSASSSTRPAEEREDAAGRSRASGRP